MVICLIGIERKSATNNLRTTRPERARTYELTAMNVNEESGEVEGHNAHHGLHRSFNQSSGIENEVYGEHRGPHGALAHPPSLEAASYGLPSVAHPSAPAIAEPLPQQPPSAPPPSPPPRSHVVVAVSADRFTVPENGALQPQQPTTAISEEPTGAFINWTAAFPGNSEPESSNAVEKPHYEPYPFAPSNAAGGQAAGVGEEVDENKAETLDPLA